MKIVWAIVLGGLAAGALDIVYAFVVYGPLAPALGLPASSTPVKVLQSVYGGWVGREASSEGGTATAGLGVLTHFGIAMAMAAFYVVTLGRRGASNPILWGFLYGIVLFLVMNYVVVPLSAAADGHFAASVSDATQRIGSTVERTLQFKRPLLLAGTIFTHTVLVGLPIALIAKRFLHQQT